MSGSRSIVSPSVTSIPFTLNTVRELSSFGATFKVNSYSPMVSPSAAVTVMVRVFSPTTNPVSPSTSKVASRSVVSTSTRTESVSGSRSTESPASAARPSMVTPAKVASLFRGTNRVTVYSSVVSSAAVTVTVSVFSRVCKSESPLIS